MARIPLLTSALTIGVVLAASPLANADSIDPIQQPAPAQVLDTPALNANMMSLGMCGERNQVVGELSKQFNETPMAVGQVDGSAVVEIFASDSGSWTILATGTDGTSCIVSAGEGFESTQLVRGVDA